MKTTTDNYTQTRVLNSNKNKGYSEKTLHKLSLLYNNTCFKILRYLKTEGISTAKMIATDIVIATANCSERLDWLYNAGLVHKREKGHIVVYTVNSKAMEKLIKDLAAAYSN